MSEHVDVVVVGLGPGGEAAATELARAGGEVLSMLTTAVHAEVPTETLRSMVYAYPNFHRRSRRRSAS